MYVIGSRKLLEDTIQSYERGMKHDLHLASFFNIIMIIETNLCARFNSLSVEDSLDMIPRIVLVTRQSVKSAFKNRRDIIYKSKCLP